MVNGVNCNGQFYPPNIKGATKVSTAIGAYCYDTQRNNINKTFSYLTNDHNPSYTWPIIGTVVSAISLITVAAIKRGRP